MSILLQCDCGREVPVSESAAGMSVPCTCGLSVSVPSLGELQRRVGSGDLRPRQNPDPSPIEGEVIEQSLGKKIRLLVLGIVVLAGGAIVLVALSQLQSDAFGRAFGQGSFVFYALTRYALGGLFVLLGAVMLIAAIIGFVFRHRLVLGRYAFQIQRGEEKVIMHIPYHNIAALELRKAMKSNVLGLAVSSTDAPDTLLDRKETEICKMLDLPQMHYCIQDEWPMTLPEIREKILAARNQS